MEYDSVLHSSATARLVSQVTKIDRDRRTADRLRGELNVASGYWSGCCERLRSWTFPPAKIPRGGRKRVAPAAASGRSTVSPRCSTASAATEADLEAGMVLGRSHRGVDGLRTGGPSRHARRVVGEGAGGGWAK